MSGHSVALIPARQGSRRVPGKNVRLLNGKPLIQYTIEHALHACEIDRVIVSTDDDEVARIAQSFGIEIIMRPSHLASDSARTIDVVKHSLEYLRGHNAEEEGPTCLVLLQPTVPIRDVSKIDKAVEVLRETGCDSVISYIKLDYYHPNRAKKLLDGRVQPYCEAEIEHVSREKLPDAYYRDGSIYAASPSQLLDKHSFYGKDSRAIINDAARFVNIDNERDWLLAEILLAMEQR